MNEAMGTEARLNALHSTVRRTILVRRISLGMFCGVAAIVILASDISPLNPLFAVPFSWLVLTVPVQWLIERQRTVRRLHLVHAGFLAFEVLLIALLVQRLGGVEWIGAVFYLYTVIYANFFLPKALGYIITGLAVGSYAAVALAEYARLIPHNPLFPTDVPLHRHLPYVITTVVVGAVGLYAALAFTVRAFAAMYERQQVELMRRERGLRRLSARLLSAREEERRRIAGKLHDELGQVLAAARWALASGESNEAGELLGRAVEGTRSLARDLRPPLLDELGLGPALRHLLERFQASSGVQVEAEIPHGQVPEPAQSAAFRVVQEALENIGRHARAQVVNIEVQRVGNVLTGRVADDGVGFSTSEAAEGLGIPGMQEWVSLARGELSVSSAPSKGTEISFHIPLT
ncbi:MAG: sensor histidine kinase [Candidatus Bipolaricaulota bacterium]